MLHIICWGFCRSETILLALHSCVNRNNCKFTSSYFHIIKNAAIFLSVFCVCVPCDDQTGRWNVAFEMRMHRGKKKCLRRTKSIYIIEEKEYQRRLSIITSRKHCPWRKKSANVDAPAVQHWRFLWRLCHRFNRCTLTWPTNGCGRSRTEHALSEPLGYKLQTKSYFSSSA